MHIVDLTMSEFHYQESQFIIMMYKHSLDFEIYRGNERTKGTHSLNGGGPADARNLVWYYVRHRVLDLFWAVENVTGFYVCLLSVGEDGDAGHPKSESRFDQRPCCIHLSFPDHWNFCIDGFLLNPGDLQSHRVSTFSDGHPS